MESVTDIALGLSVSGTAAFEHRGCPGSIRDCYEHPKMQQGLERSRRQSEQMCVVKRSEANHPWMSKRDYSLQVATRWEIKEMKKISPCLLFSS